MADRGLAGSGDGTAWPDRGPARALDDAALLTDATVPPDAAAGRSRGSLVRLALAPLSLLLGYFVLASCNLLPGWSGASPGAGGGPRPSGASWVVVAQGKASASPSARAVSPSPAMSVGVPVAVVPRGLAGTPRPDCVGVQRIGQINGLTVTPGAGSAAVSWLNPGGSNLVEYRLTAIPQRLVTGHQPALKWQTVAPGAPCAPMTASVAGLARRAPYVFSLDVVVTGLSGNGVRTSTVGRSQVVYTR
jgi:hypothetical protein